MAIASSFLGEAPVDLSGMAQALGLRVSFVKMDDSVSGRITRTAANGFHVEINASHSHYRQRFTLAHEIAHVLLHRDLIGDGIEDNALYRSRLSNSVETEANQMAARLLMPARLVRDAHRAGVKWLAGLGTAFGVSEAAMRIRLKQLGLGG